MLIHQHPDGLIYIREVSEGKVTKTLFEGSLIDAARLIGQAIDPLPEGVTERQYWVGEFCSDIGKGGSQPGPFPWPQGELMLAKLDKFKEADEKRKKELADRANPKPPEPAPETPPTDEEAAKEARERAERNSCRGNLRAFAKALAKLDPKKDQLSAEEVIELFTNVLPLLNMKDE